jgi:hypothetical protein
MKRLSWLLLVLLTGCVPLGRNTHLVLGLGVFRVQQTNEVKVVKVDALGIHAGDGRFNLGLSSVMTANIPTNSNTVLEIKK